MTADLRSGAASPASRRRGNAPSDQKGCRVFVVSLATAKDRRRQFEERAAEARAPWSYFDAHTSLAEGLVYHEAEALRHKGRSLRPGELGCYSSHYALWKQLVESGEDRYVILEDDVVADWDMIELLRTREWEPWLGYLRLYFKKPGPFRIVKRRFVPRGPALVELEHMAFGTQGYVIDRATAAVLIDYCRHILRPIDDQMDRSWEHGIPNYSLFPFPILERIGQSTIGAERFDDDATSGRGGGVDRKVRRALEWWRRLVWRTTRRFARGGS